MVEFKTQYGMMQIDPDRVAKLETDGNLTVIYVAEPGTRWPQPCIEYVVSDSYSEAMRKLGRNV